MATDARPEIRLLPGHGKRLKRGHPWLYSNEIRMDEAARGLTPGTLVEIVGTDGRSLGVAMFNPHSLISGRLLSREPGAAIDSKFVARTLSRALTLRDSLFAEPYYRLVHGEVIDFIDVHLWGGYTWPTFNVADACIVVGVAILITETFFEERSARAAQKESETREAT